jgi:hypothetical protein
VTMEKPKTPHQKAKKKRKKKKKKKKKRRNVTDLVNFCSVFL